MEKSKFLKDQASLVKRTATSLKKIVEQIDWENVNNNESVSIGRLERDTLLKAASILQKIGSKKSLVAKDVKAKELARDKLIELSTKEAELIISKWNVAETNLDKVSLVIGAGKGHLLAHYLKNGLEYSNRVTTPEDWVELINELVGDSIKNIPADAAYHAVTKKLTILEVMKAAEDKISVIKTEAKAALLAKELAAKINP